MPSVFTRIVEREIPAHILREDSDFLAFLDVRPIREGHSLVIPKAEVPDIFDLPESLLAGLLPFARPVAQAIQHVTQAARIGVAVIGLEVPNTHLHLVPIDGLQTSIFVVPIPLPKRSSRRPQSVFGQR
jgi:histidine triad (HIT) family protein